MIAAAPAIDSRVSHVGSKQNNVYNIVMENTLYN